MHKFKFQRQTILLLGIYLKKKNTNSKRYIHFNVHRNIIHNCQDMKANCVPQLMNG